MGVSAKAERRRGSRQSLSACLVALLACLAFAPNAVAEAEPASATAAAAGDTPGAGTAAAEPAPSSTAANDAGGPQGQTAGTTSAEGSAASTAVQDDTAESDKATGADKAPDQDEQAENGSKPENAGNGAAKSENGTKAENEQGGSVDQSAGASANAEQKDTGNKHEDVRVDKPGNGPHVDQRNEATADAEATAHADTPDTTSIGQGAAADATAAQTDVGNTAVTVRVDSAGDNGDVAQANGAAGSAAAVAGGSDEGVAAAEATATQDGASNTNVSVRVFSPGNDGSVNQSNDATATAAASGGSASEAATALQDDVRNTNVSIRVESPGSSGAVSQGSSAHASVSGDLSDDEEPGGSAVAVTTNDVDTALSVVVQDAGLDRPGVLQVWEWTWTWLRDESQSLSSVVQAALSTWTWNWDETNGAQGKGSVHSRAATEDEASQAGTWSWSWDWQRSGLEGWSWQWSWSQALQCGSCIWVWNWSWLWTGAPANASTAEQAAPTPSSTPVQINSAQAEAVATVSATVEQVVDQDGEGGTQFAGQVTDIVQLADAVSVVVQRNVGSVSTGAMPHQANIARSKSETILAADSSQSVSQVLGVDDPGAGSQWSGQQVGILQGGASSADITQADALLTGAAKHEALAVASATISAGVTQDTVQDGLVAGGTLDQWAGQLTLVQQLADASAVTIQTGTRTSRQSGGSARASATAADLLFVDQTIGQGAVRIAGEGIQDAEQIALVAQDAGAGASTTQRAGTAATDATSEAIALNRAAVVQSGSQVANGTSGYDHQQLSQRSIVIQEAYASSTSLGGISGTATVLNCAVTTQGATQAIGATAGGLPRGRDTTTFCFPAPEQHGVTEPPSGAADGSTISGAHTLVAMYDTTMTRLGASSVVELSTISFPASRSGAAAHRDRRGTARHRTLEPVFGAARPHESQAAPTQSPVPPSTQARIDTRPGSHAGDGDAGREPPLPPAGDPPMWVSALAAAASSGGPSGIAAILLAFMLVPPVVRRAREGSVVRRPATVFSQAEVPV